MGYDNANRGALFRNQDHAQETDPLYRGTINVAGVEYFLSAWLKTSKAGERYMSLSVKRKPVVRRRTYDQRRDEIN
jgi:uncharacterized protein (DUF736 family)